MSGPVWRFEGNETGACDLCLKVMTGLYVEGEVADNELRAARRICPACLQLAGPLAVSGEVGQRRPGPAYAIC